MQQCWKANKEERPDFSEVLSALEILSKNKPWTHLVFEISEKRRSYVDENQHITHDRHALRRIAASPGLVLTLFRHLSGQVIRSEMVPARKTEFCRQLRAEPLSLFRRAATDLPAGR